MKRAVTVTGLRELDAALGELGKSLGKGVLRRVGMKALEPVKERAQMLVPVDEGRLRDSIVIGTSLNKSARRSERGEARSSVTVYCGTSNRNGVPREYGTWRTAAQPFMRPAWESENGNVLDSVGDQLGPEIEKTAARAARKRARMLK
ncbi:HK97-gp10 family putative phage morphogenesis protein [Sphingosinicella sp. LY1275]|uniref:HK97-gp10 family putative phage morphogenesis protein n=1 Tax=Sphingosinicella sp. LY1275 TaxID=3095379 RepID=UPI002ADEA8B9|nr:HK97-gp10 family putative phage morphogenesis protein [Sphingosinicella sp. LY1275]MEA1015590.1 HK97-gp10 family putative phage morphogenesis protein [Sphingosinicella sp. LY1275]